MKTLLLKNWNLMRLLRLAIGVWAIILAFQRGEAILGLMGGLLILMAVMNNGCCGINNCATKTSRNKNSIQKKE